MEQKFPTLDIYNTDGHIEHWISELQKWKAKHVLQEIITGAAAGLKDGGPYDTINAMQRQLAKLGRDTRLVRDIDLVGNMQERIDNLQERIAIRESGKKILGVPSGFEAIDSNFGGWQNGDFIVVAAWTEQGKSWFALKCAQNAWSEGYRVLYFSLEMSGLQIGYRFDTILSGAEGEGFSNTSLTHAENITFDHYKNWLGEIMYDKHPFVVVTNEDLDEVTQNTVTAKIEQWKPDLVVLDYIGLFDDASGAMGETEKLKNLSKAFKRIGIKTGVPILAITSVTMQNDHGERAPELHELAWSKQLAYDSDLCLTMCRHGNIMEVVSKKNRRGVPISMYIQADFDKGIFKETGKNSILAQNDKEEND